VGKPTSPLSLQLQYLQSNISGKKSFSLHFFRERRNTLQVQMENQEKDDDNDDVSPPEHRAPETTAHPLVRSRSIRITDSPEGKLNMSLVATSVPIYWAITHLS